MLWQQPDEVSVVSIPRGESRFFWKAERRE
jgi:hypothetical protein